MQRSGFRSGRLSRQPARAPRLIARHQGGDARSRHVGRYPRHTHVGATGAFNERDARVGLCGKALRADAATGARSGWQGVDDSQGRRPDSENWAARRRWNADPLRFYVGWLFPISALVGVFSKEVVELLARCPLEVVWKALAGLGLTSSMAVTVLSYSGILFTFAVVPMLDRICGRDSSPPPEGAAESGAYMIPVYLYVPLYLGVLALSYPQASTLWAFPARFWGAVLGLASAGSMSINVAHVMLHRRCALDQFLCSVLLWPLCYMHWGNCHLCHHRKVATPEDPSTARFGEALLPYFVRDVTDGLREAIDMEKNRLRSKGKAFMSLSNRFLLWTTTPAMLVYGVYRFCGVHALIMMFCSSVGGVFIMEAVNYVQHYGLERKKLANGKYEPVGPQHSWSADWSVSGPLLFEVQRHSHHHARSGVQYQALHSISSAPMLPASLPTMVLVALWPPLFFKLMNPRLEQVRKRAEVDPWN